MQKDTSAGNTAPSAKSKLDLLTAAAKRRRRGLSEPLRGVVGDEQEVGVTAWSFRQNRREYSALND